MKHTAEKGRESGQRKVVKGKGGGGEYRLLTAKVLVSCLQSKCYYVAARSNHILFEQLSQAAI